jgi:hypothetical protein
MSYNYIIKNTNYQLILNFYKKKKKIKKIKIKNKKKFFLKIINKLVIGKF